MIPVSQFIWLFPTLGKTSLLNVLSNRMPLTKKVHFYPLRSHLQKLTFSPFKSKFTGQLMLNGKCLKSNNARRRFARLSAYVVQEDALCAFLTATIIMMIIYYRITVVYKTVFTQVLETLCFAAALQLPSSVSRAERDEFATAVLYQLGLKKANMIVP